MKHHVHVYKLVGLQEFDIEADTVAEANAKALKLVQPDVWEFPDCKVIALVPTPPEVKQERQ